MIILWLAISLVVPLQDEPILLEHATSLKLIISPDDPVLEDIGPSKTFRYVLESDDSVLFVYAESPEADLVLRACFGSDSSDDGEAAGTAALIVGKRRSRTFEDDDSGGGTTPFLRLECHGSGTLTIQVAAKSPANRPQRPGAPVNEPVITGDRAGHRDNAHGSLLRGEGERSQSRSRRCRAGD